VRAPTRGHACWTTELLLLLLLLLESPKGRPAPAEADLHLVRDAHAAPSTHGAETGGEVALANRNMGGGVRGDTHSLINDSQGGQVKKHTTLSRHILGCCRRVCVCAFVFLSQAPLAA
jgi:hypothetical protein